MSSTSGPVAEPTSFGNQIAPSPTATAIVSVSATIFGASFTSESAGSAVRAEDRRGLLRPVGLRRALDQLAQRVLGVLLGVGLALVLEPRVVERQVDLLVEADVREIAG